MEFCPDEMEFCIFKGTKIIKKKKQAMVYRVSKVSFKAINFN